MTDVTGSPGLGVGTGATAGTVAPGSAAGTPARA